MSTQTFTLTISVYNGVGGTTSPSGTITGTVGDVVTVYAYPSTGYVFDHWLADGVQNYYDNPISGPMVYAGAHSFVAYFVPSATATTLTFACNPIHGTVPWTAQMSGRLTDASGIGIPNATISIQTFNETNTWVYTGINPTTLSDGTYSVPFEFLEVNGWVAGVAQPMRALFEGDATHDASFSTSITVTMDSVTPQYWSLVLSASSGGSISPTGTLTGASGSSTPLITASPNSGYGLRYWLFDGVTQYTENPISLPINDSASHTLQAVFAQTFTLTISVNGGVGGTTTPSGVITGFLDDVVTVTAYPSTGYQFDHWLADGVQNYYENPISGPMVYAGAHTFEAYFVPSAQNWSLTISADTGGTVSPSGTITGASGASTPPITATPTSGAFNYWLYDGVTQYAQNPLTLTINDTLAHTLHAVFTGGTETWDWKDEFTDRNSRWAWGSNNTGGGYKVCPATTDGFSVVQLVIPASATASAYSDDSLNNGTTNFAGKTITFETRLKFSHNMGSPFRGTFGFGFYDGGANVCWFLGCSPESVAEYQGFRAMIRRNSEYPLSLNQLVSVDLTQWNTFRIEASPTGVVFKVNGLVVASTPNPITSSMTMVLWNDNGWTSATGEAGYLDVTEDEIAYIDYVAYRDGAMAQASLTVQANPAIPANVSVDGGPVNTMPYTVTLDQGTHSISVDASVQT